MAGSKNYKYLETWKKGPFLVVKAIPDGLWLVPRIDRPIDPINGLTLASGSHDTHTPLSKHADKF